YIGSDTTYPYSIDWDVTNAQEGFVWVSASIIDVAGNNTFLWGDGGWTFFTVDKTAPQSVMTSLPEFTIATNISLSWSATDNYTNTSSITYDLQYQIGCVGNWFTQLSDTQNTSTIFYGGYGQSYCFRLRAYDLANNVELWRSPYDVRTTLIQPVNNDEVASAMMVTVPFNHLVNTRGATSNDSDPIAPCGYNNGNSVWYRYTATTTDAIRISTAGSSFDTILSVWMGNPANKSLVGCNDDNNASLQSQIDLYPTVNQTYYILVSGYNHVVGDLMFTVTPLATVTTSFNEQELFNALQYQIQQQPPTGQTIFALPDFQPTDKIFMTIRLQDGTTIILTVRLASTNGVNQLFLE
ncbi:MAG TPA: hypothetical protein PLZ51_09065, partial [Aggregatilineales bacterium]|nr:hypothetical protein [Aggregatilineales bacterium]